MVSAVLGAATAMASWFWGPLVHWPIQAWQLACKVYQTVGIAIVGLLPLGIWACTLFIRQADRTNSADPVMELDYGFISRTATLLGLLGTIIALAAAGGRLATDVSHGSSSSILKIIPLVGQALISSIVGIVISLFADLALHTIERKRLRNTSL